MSIEAIESNNAFNNSEKVNAPFFDDASEATLAAEDMLSPVPTVAQGEPLSNLGGAPEEYNNGTVSAGQLVIPEMGEISDFGQFAGDPAGPPQSPPLLNSNQTSTNTTTAGEAPADATSLEPTAENGNTAVNGEVTDEALRDNPDMLPEAGTKGLEVTGMELTLDSNGMLSETSKGQVNELVGYMSDTLGGVEVLGSSYVKDNGNVGLHLTSGNSNGVYSDYIDESTVYNVHTHPGSSTTPSQLDLDNEIPGAEDAIVGTDGIPGNEDGSNYHVYG
jgi:hypothetical protein